ncbi:YihY/virulence factor BrkB family protein [Streptomyces sp. NBC_01013]|uniref:YihY/virulence factor BrkB family protein n=1 Tax=Streptomyces sp. NBC_01013 TaxID=2903718 RepID=UPI00386767C9|nr:YihY/virulence factor BrkB family protein [Streptomyces sp. NBC_01013]
MANEQRSEQGSPRVAAPGSDGRTEQKEKGDRHGSAGPDAQVERDAPAAPTEMGKAAWWAVLKRTAKEFQQDELTDRAAGLTYYGVLSLFPALLVLVSLLGIAGESTTQKVLDNVGKLAPGAARDVLTSAITQLKGSGGTGSVMAIVGLLGALWVASGYVAAFMRAANSVYDLPEGRPLWKILPVRVGLTLVLMLLACASALMVVLTGGIARQLGALVGIGDTALSVWSIVKWPALVVCVAAMLAILYWAAPNAKGRGFTFGSLGSVLALLIWVVTSAGFAFYVANYGSYNKTYGALAGVIVFLVWLWITNLAILLGLEFDAEMARERAILGGHPPFEEPYVEPRDTRAWSDEDRRAMGETGPSTELRKG